jgi:putative membrane protein (TIGR04086 family)
VLLSNNIHRTGIVVKFSEGFEYTFYIGKRRDDMEKRGEGKEGIPVLALAKCLLVSYVLTLLLLCLLALLLYKLHLTEGIVTIAISAIYVATTFTAGLLAGKRMEKQKFLWGAFMGAAYFVILAVVSVLIRTPETALGNSFWTTMVLCVAGGTLGGMLG